MTITIDAADAVAGFLQPGDHVDIIAVFTEGSDSVARTILQNVTLLAVNANIRPVRQVETGPAEAKTTGKVEEPSATRVTIAATPAEAERLVAAQLKGKLKIGLRGIGDASRFATGGASIAQMFGLPQRQPPYGATATVSMQPQKPAPRVPKKAGRLRKAKIPISPFKPVAPFSPLPGVGTPEPQQTIKVIKGTQVQEVTVDR